MEIIDKIGEYVAALGVLGILVLLPLFLSQRRDLRRLRAWMAAAPDHPAADLTASEAILDRAEAQLEALERQATEAPPTARPSTPAAPLPAAQRVTSERPALERITSERAALAPHPRWRRFASTATQPRALAIVAVAAVAVAAVAIFASGRLLGGEPGAPPPRPGAIDPAQVQVAVLNGTSVPGLAANVADDVRANGFKLGTVSNSERPYDQTVVMFERGQQRAAVRVAHDLGVKPVQPIDEAARAAAGAADVVVIAGADRAKL